MMQTIAESGGGMSARVVGAHQHFRPEPGRGVRQRRAAQAHAAADRARRGQGLLRRHRAEHRAQHDAAEAARGEEGRPLRRRRARRSGSRPRRSPTRCCCSRARRRSRRSRKPTHGLSLFYTDFDRSRITVHEIEKMGRKCVDSNELFFAGFEIPAADLIGEEGRGFEYILHGMNPGARADRRRGGRHRPGSPSRARSPTRRSASSSTGRSARTRRSSIRSRRTGWSSRRRTWSSSRRRGNTTPA